MADFKLGNNALQLMLGTSSIALMTGEDTGAARLAAAQAQAAAAEANDILGNVTSTGGSALTAITDAKNTAIGAVQSEGANAINTANSAAATAANLVGTITPADLLDIEAGLVMAKAPSFRGTGGRMKRIGRMNWLPVTDNEARIYVNNSGAIEGVLQAGAENIISANWYAAPANSTSAQWGSISGGTGSTVSQVGSHAETDFGGGSGRLVRFYGGTGANAECRFPNIQVPFVSGDVVRFLVWVYFANPAAGFTATLFPRAASGSGISGNIGINVANDPAGGSGIVTLANGTRRGIDLFDDSETGRRFYRIWAEYTATNTGTFYPAISLPAGAVMVGMAQAVLNPQQAIPSVVPVMASKAYIAEGIQTAPNVPVRVEWQSLRTGRTSVSDGLLIPPRHRATPVLELERKISISRATEITGRPYPLPGGPREGLLFVDGMTDYLGPGDWDTVPNFTSGTSFLRSAYNDPKLWAVLPRIRVNNAAITKLTIDKVGFWLRCPVGNTTGASADAQGIINLEVAPSKVEIGDVLCVGASQEWSQFIVPAGQELPPSFIGRNVGRVNIIPGANSGTLTIGRLKVVDANGGIVPTVAAGQTLTINATGLASDRITGDHRQLNGTGTLNLNQGAEIRGSFRAAPANFWQIPYEIEVNTGPTGSNGWVALSASGLTFASLPLWRRFTWMGTHSGGVITYAPKPERQLWVSSWAYATSTGTNKVGFQYCATPMLYRDPTTDAELYRTSATPDGSVWQSDDVGIPSPTNPGIRIRHTSVRHTSLTANVPQAGPLSAGAGTHGDNFQIVGALTWSFVCPCVIEAGEGGQGTFVNASSICTNYDAKGIFMLNSVNAIGISGSATYKIAGLMLPSYSMDRDASGNQYMPLIDVPAGTTLNAGGLYIATNSSYPTGLRTVAGTVASAPIPVAAARLAGNVLTPAATNQPSATNFLEYFVRPASLKDGKVNATPENLQLTGYAFDRVPELRSMLDTAMGVWNFAKDLEARCTLGPRTHTTSVANTAAVNTALTLVPRDPVNFSATLRGNRIVRGDPRGLFWIDNGVLKTAALMRDSFGGVMVANYALETDAGERVSVMIFTP